METKTVQENGKTALDKRIEKLYNDHAFTNEELEDIRQEMAWYANEVVRDINIEEENYQIMREYGAV